MRISPNLDFYNMVVAQGRGEEFHRAFRKWKVFAQHNPRKYREYRPKKIKTWKFLEYVYREGSECLRDFGYLTSGKKNGGGKFHKLKSLQLKLKEEYIRATMDTESVFTVPVVAGLLALEGLDPAAAGAVVEANGAPQQCQMIQILDMHPEAKKYMATRKQFSVRGRYP
jgi:hypothetical protein